jgi:hypothetical protein
MDIKNRFHTDSTYLLERLEHLLVVVACAGVGLWHWADMDWIRFIVAFAVIDLIGYIPGAIAYRRRGGGSIPPIYHYLYNVTHSYLMAAALAAAWAWAIGGFEWAMLALPIHLSGDRGVFGNIYKPLELPFEPVAVQPAAK